MKPKWCNNSEFPLGEAELEAIQKAVTAGNDPDLADRAEKLKQRLGG